MKKTYKYGHRSAKHRHVIAVVLIACLVIFGPLAFFIYRDISLNGSAAVEGSSQVVGQIQGMPENKLVIDEATYSMELPDDWKEFERSDTEALKSVSWQSTKKNLDARKFTVYVDKIPANKPVNRLLPVTIQGSRFIVGSISDNCISFTGGGVANTDTSSQLKPALAKWQGVDFICNLPNFVENEIGVGTVGSPVNQVTITGESKGTHTYFFLYTDHTIQPDYTILSNALESFRAK